jgi:hypothetical protein
VMRHGGLLGLVVARDFLVWEKVHEAVHAVPFVLGVLCSLAPLALAKRRPAALFASGFYFPVLAYLRPAALLA